MVRFRQLLDLAQHRLLLIPLLFVTLAVGLSQLMLAVDRSLTDADLPTVLETTVGSGRAILSAIASGLIASVTLLLSLMLVAVQLASTQFSPRTLRDWIGDRTLQRTIGLGLGTTVYCLLILRETRTLGEGEALTPHMSVLLGLVLGVASLVAVVLSVDHLTNRLRIGAVAKGIMSDTVALIERNDQLGSKENPAVAPTTQTSGGQAGVDVPGDAMVVTSSGSGWVQQIDDDALLAGVPQGSTVFVPVELGGFVMPDAPIAWIWPLPDDGDCADRVRSTIALGDTRTLQQDVGFGILQMVDIAVRALSPGVNDPNTANDLIVHVGVVLLALWERPESGSVQEADGRTLIRHDLTHADYLRAAFDPLRRHGAGDPSVAATIVRTLVALRSEVVRRDLPGPLAPIDEVIEQTLEAVEASELSEYDKSLVRDVTTRA